MSRLNLYSEIKYFFKTLQLKNNTMDTPKDITPDVEKTMTESEKLMTRKEVLKKVGYAALTATTLMVLMKSPAKASGSTPDPPGGW
jgi:hypothetical protein